MAAGKLPPPALKKLMNCRRLGRPLSFGGGIFLTLDLHPFPSPGRGRGTLLDKNNIHSYE
ncbi:MAG: hypothetical protein ACLTEJ_06435 [Neglectibacter timonensis]|uniref:hypothetical protein n=1 Tax=Neglectibacter timonensis TaxID=1776382 RepID=UPI003994ECC5